MTSPNQIVDEMRVIAPSLWGFETPDPASRTSTELLFGEDVTILAQQERWLKVKAKADGYESWVALDALAPASQSAAPTHQVTATSALVYAEPDFHGAPVLSLPMNAAVTAAPQQSAGSSDFVELDTGGYIPRQHLATQAFSTDPIEIAMLFLGTPYAWGGRTRGGIDCSGLVQQSLWACGLECPRDSGDQWSELGAALEPDDVPRHGDVVFFPGHVGFYLDGEKLLHANATHMRCTIDPLSEVISWVAKASEKPLTGFKRLPI